MHCTGLHLERHRYEVNVLQKFISLAWNVGFNVFFSTMAFRFVHPIARFSRIALARPNERIDKIKWNLRFLRTSKKKLY